MFKQCQVNEWQLTNGRNDDHSTDDEEREPELADKCRMLGCLLEPPFDKVPRHSRGHELVRYLTIVRQELNLTRYLKRNCSMDHLAKATAERKWPTSNCI